MPKPHNPRHCSNNSSTNMLQNTLNIWSIGTVAIIVATKLVNTKQKTLVRSNYC